VVKISVIIPVFNAEKFLRKSVLSAANQNFVSEIIIVNDNSTDNSINVAYELKKLFPDKLKIVSNPSNVNVGAGKCRTIGIKEARYDWVAFLDADDYYYPNRFENAVELISSKKYIDGVYEAVENIFENENARITFLKTRPKRYKKGSLRKKLNLFTLDYRVESNQLFKTLINANNGFFHFNGIIIKKKLFKSVGYLNDKLRLCQDTEVFMKLAIIGKLIPGNLDKPVAARLVHVGNRVYNNDNKLVYFTILAFIELEKWARSNNVSSYMLSEIRKKNTLNCAQFIFKTDIYRLYRVKFLFFKIAYPFFSNLYLLLNKKKYEN
jgi:glycosyltransferase involved in cell wall biosynthesis